MNKLSLFSGIGGDNIASEWAGIKTVCFVEKDKFCQRVLRYHWPDIPIIEDVRDVNKKTLDAIAVSIRCDRDKLERQRVQRDISAHNEVRASNRASRYIDIIAGGFPCQPHSVAGQHKGSADDRDLWPEFRRVIGEIGSRWVVAENVPGLFSTDSGQFFRGILRDLSEMGYSVGWCTFGAVDVGAWHRRDRVFIVAYSRLQYQYLQQRDIWDEFKTSYKTFPDTTERIGQSGSTQTDKRDSKERSTDVCDSQGGRQQEQCEYQRTEPSRSESERTGRRESESRLGYLADGLSYWLVEPDGIPRVATGIKERVNKLKSLGNAVVPYQIYPVYRAIVEIEKALDKL